MSLPKFSISQSLFVNLVSVILLIIGMIVLFGMNRETFPNVDFDIVTITTAYPGATPLDIEKLITVPIENELKEVDGIKEINSSSSSGTSVINVEIDPDEKDKQKVIRDVQTAVDKVKDLPDDIVNDPLVNEITSGQYAIVEVAMSGDMSEHRLQQYADSLKDEIEEIKGVSKVDKSGFRDREIKILLHPDTMRKEYVSFDEVEQALISRNISIPAGEINTETTEFNVRTTGEFTTPEEVGNVIIRANDTGNWLRVKDIAEIKDSFKKEDIVYKTFGTRSINLIVKKKASGDALDVVDQVRAVGDKFLKQAKDDLKIAYVNDYSYFARRRLNVLKNNGWASLVLVVVALLLFLQKRVVAVTVLGIPIAFFTSFIFMSVMGVTINMISMFGLIIVLGMLVDDGIIVSENVCRYVEQGMLPRQAAVKGSEEVVGAVTVAVLTTIAAFSPLLFMTGIIGKFIRQIPTVVIIALLASLAEAIIILPSHLADFIKAHGNDKKDKNKKVESSKETKWFKKITENYTKIVTFAIKHKYKAFFGFLIILAISVSVVVLGIIKFVLFPSAGINYFFIRAEAPIGTPLQKTNEMILPVEEIVSKISTDDMDSYVTSVGSISEDRHDPFAGWASNFVQVTVYLKPEQDRKRDVDEIIDEVKRKIKEKNISGFDDIRFDKPEAGPPVGKAVEVNIRGENFKVLDEIAKEFMDFLKTINGTEDVTWDNKPGKEEIRVNINYEKAAASGLTVAQIAKTVRAVFEGVVATKIKPVKAEEETDVTVMFPESAAHSLEVFDNILIRNEFGKLIRLKQIAKIEKVAGTTTIKHLNGKRVVTASCNIDSKSNLTSMEINRKLAKKFKNIEEKYLGYKVKYGGEQEETVESIIDGFKAAFFSFLLIYLILASFFRSLVQPFVVMFAIPFGLIGVVFAFYIHGMPLSFMAIIGIVGLSGIVVNDSIVLVDFINKLRLEGLSRRDSIIKGGQMRLRAVMLTTITTAGGLSTVAYGIGGKDPFLVPMALAICWGIVFATVLTLILIPCIYSIVDEVSLKLTKHSSLINCKKIGDCS